MTEEKRVLILTEDEKLVCEQIAVDGSLFGQRAQALLALDSGATQELASLDSGLTPNQVKYWQGRFRTRRLDIFPDDLLTAARTGIEMNVPVVAEAEKNTAVKPSKQENPSAEDQPDKESKKKKKSTESKKNTKKKSVDNSKSKKTKKKKGSKKSKKTKKKGKKKKSGKKSKKANKKKSGKKSKKKK